MNGYIFWLIIFLALAILLREDWVYYLVYIVGGVWLLSLLWAKYHLRWLTIVRTVPTHAFSGETVSGTVQIRNRGLLPVPWVRVHELIPSALRSNARYQTVLSLRGRSGINFEYDLLCRQRGYYQVGPLTIRTGDLFGFADSGFGATEPESMIVFPQVISLEQVGLKSRMLFGALATRRRIFEDPTRLSGVRPYLFGDELRHVHWKASAHEGHLLSKKYDPAIALDVVIAVDLDSRSYGTSGVFSNSEWAIVIAASLASYLSERQQGIGLRSNGQDAVHETPLVPLPVRAGRDHLISILEALARVRVTEAEDPFTQWLARHTYDLAWGTTLIVIVPVLTGDMLWILHEQYRKGINVMVMVLVGHEGYPELKSRGEALGLAIYRIERTADLQELALVSA